MASLSNILKVKGRQLVAERGTGIEKGKIFVYSAGNQNFLDAANFCWEAPDEGIAVVEIWGAAGSGARMCCCGAGLPGNPGAYSKKTIPVESGSFVCGTTGISCNDEGSDSLCFRGCSEPTEICWVSTNDDGCMCAMGGRGGYSTCTTTTEGPYCCFVSLNYSHTPFENQRCGMICNYIEAEDFLANAYGGDINCNGGFSCVSFFCACSNRPCAYQYHVATSPGIFSLDGAVLTYNGEENTGYTNWSGQGPHQLTFALNAASRRPNQGMMFSACWASTRACGCYEAHGRVPYVPYGVPGTPASPCDGVRDSGTRGGFGLVRIKFIGSN